MGSFRHLHSPSLQPLGEDEDLQFHLVVMKSNQWQTAERPRKEEIKLEK